MTLFFLSKKPSLPSFNLEQTLLSQSKAIQEEKEKTELEMGRLKKVQEVVTFYAEKMRGVMQTFQKVIKFQEVQKPAPFTLSLTAGEDSLLQIEQIMKFAEKLQKGSLLEEMEQEIQKLNQETGQTRALALQFQQETKSLEELIYRLEKQVQEKEKALLEMKKTAKTMEEFNKTY